MSGGFAYHGRIAALRGKFVFGDVVRGRLFAADLAAMKKADDGDSADGGAGRGDPAVRARRGGNRVYVTFRELIERTMGATVHARRPAHQPQPRRRAVHHVAAGRHDPDAGAVGRAILTPRGPRHPT